MADIEKWITINGQHIPIMKGESRAKAVSNFIKSKRNKDKASIVKQLVKATRKDLKTNARSRALNQYSAELTAKQLLKNTRPTIKEPKQKEDLFAPRNPKDRFSTKFNEAKERLENAQGSYKGREEDERIVKKGFDRVQYETSKYKLKTDKTKIKGIGKTKNMKKADRAYNKAIKESYAQRQQDLEAINRYSSYIPLFKEKFREVTTRSIERKDRAAAKRKKSYTYTKRK